MQSGPATTYSVTASVIQITVNNSVDHDRALPNWCISHFVIFEPPGFSPGKK